MKKDIQEAISNNIYEYNAIYRSLMFSKYNIKEDIKSFFFMKELNIKIKNNKLLYHIKLDENIINKISEKDKKEIQNKYLEKRAKNLLVERFHLDRFIDYYKTDIIGQFIKENNEEKSRKARENEIAKMKLIQQILKDYFNIETSLKEGEKYLFLETIQKEINFNKGMLNEIEDIFNQIDVFSISPYFEGENVTGIKLFWAIDLTR